MFKDEFDWTSFGETVPLSVFLYFFNPTASGLFAVISKVGGGHIGPPPRNAPRGPQNGDFGRNVYIMLE